MNLALTFACALYDRMVPLYAGRVKPDGIDLTFIAGEDQRATFDRMGKDQPFDLAEMSISEVVTRFDTGDSPFVALPVWPSRVFRHGHVFVNRRAGIRTPKDLEGKRIGVPLYTMSAALWIRGILTDEYGVDFSTVLWIQGALESAGAHGNPALPATKHATCVEENRSGHSLWQLLVAGELDAITVSRAPTGFPRSDEVVRLFENFAEVERDYFARTKIFPIMHTVAVRRDRYDAHPFIAGSLYAAFERSKELALEDLHTGTLRAMLPLLPAYLEETERIFGADPWPYGLEPSRPTLEALVRYLHREGHIAKLHPIEDLFVSVS